MAQTLQVCLGATAALLFWGCIGLPLARRLMPLPLATASAPALGWAIHSAIALPVLSIIGLSAASVLSLALLSAAVALLALKGSHRGESGLPLWLYVAAGVVALAPAAAVLPKIGADGVAFAAPIFDHSKVAIIDEMSRLGVPPANPFFGVAGEGVRLGYYYLWHFSAAELALAAGISGWEADAAMTWFTALVTLLLMVGLAAWLAQRTAAGALVLLLAIAGSLRPVLAWLLGPENVAGLMQSRSGFGGWYFQVSWSPQNVAGAGLALLAIVLLTCLSEKPGKLRAVVLALVLAATFETSTWIGAVVLPLATVAAGLLLLWRRPSADRRGFLFWAVLAGIGALALAAPMLRDQLAAAASRSGPAPIALAPFPVLGDAFPHPVRRILDLPAYWLLLLPVELPAIAIAGAVSLIAMLRARDLAPARREMIVVLAILAAASLLVSSLLASRIGDNNDLGWRAVLPAVMVLIVVAAAGLARWLEVGPKTAVAAGIVAALLGLPDTAVLVYGNIVGERTASARAFAATPELWEAVRRYAAPDERIGNNPRHLADLTPWPINLSWALLADRRSCYAGREFVLPFSSLSRSRLAETDARFIRIFAGEATPEEVRDLAARYDCRVIVLTPQDGAWTRDPFASSPSYRLLEAQDGWRIYRASRPAETPIVKGR